jgi:hypothetical protein
MDDRKVIEQMFKELEESARQNAPEAYELFHASNGVRETQLRASEIEAMIFQPPTMEFSNHTIIS